MVSESVPRMPSEGRLRAHTRRAARVASGPLVVWLLAATAPCATYVWCTQFADEVYRSEATIIPTREDSLGGLGALGAAGALGSRESWT